MQAARRRRQRTWAVDLSFYDTRRAASPSETHDVDENSDEAAAAPEKIDAVPEEIWARYRMKRDTGQGLRELWLTGQALRELSPRVGTLLNLRTRGFKFGQLKTSDAKSASTPKSQSVAQKS